MANEEREERRKQESQEERKEGKAKALQGNKKDEWETAKRVQRKKNSKKTAWIRRMKRGEKQRKREESKPVCLRFAGKKGKGKEKGKE